MKFRSVIKKIARREMASTVIYCGFHHLSGLVKKDPGIRILCYHSISDQPANSFTVSTRDFAVQMRFLAESCTVLPLDQAVDLLRSGQPAPRRAVVITFDDGFNDAYNKAFPILKDCALPATMFLPVDFIDGLPSDRKTRIFPGQTFLSWEQVHELSQNAVTFGSHSLTHESLAHLPLEIARSQVEKSKARLESQIGRPVTCFSYPYGGFHDFNQSIEQMVADSGYVCAVSGINGLNHPSTNLFILRRTKMERDDGLNVFQKALQGGLDPWFFIDKFGWFLQGQNH